MADKRVDELTDLDALADADSFPVRDASATTELKEVTAAQIGTYMASELGGTFQPLDSDLTAIAALSTTSFGRGLLELANAGALRTAINVADGAEVNTVDSVNSATGAVVLDADDIDDTATTNKFASAAQLSAVDGLAATYQPLDSDLTAIAALTTTSFGRGLLELANAAALRSSLNVEDGADVTDTANVEAALEAATLTGVTGATGDEFLIIDATDGGLKAVVYDDLPGAGGGLSNIVEDTTPQLGGNLDLNGNVITGLEIGTDVQAHSAVLDATTASFTTADESKLDGIEASADVTDTANVTAAGALMDSEVDADIKTLSLPASTTISTFGATLVDDADAATARTTLDVDQAGTDNSTDVTLAGSLDYITISGQTITRNAVDLAADVTGTLPLGNGGTGGTTAAAAKSNLSPLNTVAASGATETLVMGVNDVTMDEACTFTFPSVGAGHHEFTLILRGAFTPTFPASVDWPDASAPTYASPTEFSFATVDSGTTWLGVGAPGLA